ncbi:MAG: hypothetical protein LBQ44_10195, partial [Treponema sp.]|nr:hypothetical protein [Treponema sp.]
PLPRLYKTGRDGSEHRYDFSYSGLKTAVVNQLEQFRAKPRPVVITTDHRNKGESGDPAARYKDELADIAASFQKTAVEILARGLFRAVEDTGLSTVVSGGGVAANSCLRARLEAGAAGGRELRVVFPPPELCGDNGAMIAGIGERYLLRGDRSPMNVSASARVREFKKRYP